MLTVLLLCAGLFLLDRLLLRLEAAGHLYYRKNKPSPAALSSALNLVQGVFEPGRKHAADAQRGHQVELDQKPDGPPPGVRALELRVAEEKKSQH